MHRYRSQGIWISMALFAFTVITAIAPTPSRASETFQDALYYANQGQLEHAIDLWSRFIRRHPRSYAAHANRGTAYLWTGHVFKGIMDWHTARELSPLFAYAVHQGRFLPEEDRNSTMLNFAMPFELEPDYFPSVLMTASLLLDVGRPDQAIVMFRRSMDLTKNPLLKTHFEYWAGSLESETRE